MSNEKKNVNHKNLLSCYILQFSWAVMGTSKPKSDIGFMDLSTNIAHENENLKNYANKANFLSKWKRSLHEEFDTISVIETDINCINSLRYVSNLIKNVSMDAMYQIFTQIFQKTHGGQVEDSIKRCLKTLSGQCFRKKTVKTLQFLVWNSRFTCFLHNQGNLKVLERQFIVF